MLLLRCLLERGLVLCEGLLLLLLGNKLLLLLLLELLLRCWASLGGSPVGAAENVVEGPGDAGKKARLSLYVRIFLKSSFKDKEVTNKVFEVLKMFVTQFPVAVSNNLLPVIVADVVTKKSSVLQ